MPENNSAARQTSQFPRQRPDRQTAILERANRNVVVPLGDRVPPRLDLVYVRPGATRTRPNMAAPVLVETLTCMHMRRGAAWSAQDAEIMEETRARTMGRHELARARGAYMAIWLTGLLPGRFRARAALLSCVVTAHRAGAIGALLSYTDLAGLLDIGARTARRWVHWLESEGLLEVIKTWRGAPAGTSRGRGYAKHLYRPGPRLFDAVGLGIMDGAAGLSPATAAMARRAATVACAAERRRINDKANVAWERQYGRPDHEPEVENEAPLLRVDIEATPSPALGDGLKTAAVPAAVKVKIKVAATPPLVKEMAAAVASTRGEQHREPEDVDRAAHKRCTTRAGAQSTTPTGGSRELAAWRPGRAPVCRVFGPLDPELASHAAARDARLRPPSSSPSSSSSSPSSSSSSTSKSPPPSKSKSKPVAIGEGADSFGRWVEVAQERRETEALERLRRPPGPRLRVVCDDDDREK